MARKKKKKRGKVLKFPPPEASRNQTEGADAAIVKVSDDMLRRMVSEQPAADIGHALVNLSIPQAARVLAMLFDLDEGTALTAAGYFQKLPAGSDDKITIIIQLEELIKQGQFNPFLLLVHKMFNLQGPVAIHMINAMRSRRKA